MALTTKIHRENTKWLFLRSIGNYNEVQKNERQNFKDTDLFFIFIKMQFILLVNITIKNL